MSLLQEIFQIRQEQGTSLRLLSRTGLERFGPIFLSRHLHDKELRSLERGGSRKMKLGRSLWNDGFEAFLERLVNGHCI
jgi:hypothetical protein